jgi:putative flippase GtrA
MTQEVNMPETRTGKVRHAVHLSRQLLIKSAGLEPSHDYSVQFVRSMVVSVAAVVANFGGSYILKDILGVYYLLSAAGSFLLGVVVNYYLSVKWVFASRQVASRHAEFLIFATILGIGLLLNLVLIAGMVEILKLNFWIALPISTVLVFFWNFLARKKILY